MELKIEAGGKCCICGYSRCLNSLSFHHKNSHEKTGNVSNMIYTHGKAAAFQEAKKCILLCSNCHGELHMGMITLPTFSS